MACFLVPAAEAVITTIATKVVEKKEGKKALECAGGPNEETKLPFSRKMKWLDRMLWGGSALLLLEHIWHGEIVPVYPFFTAGSNVILREMGTVGVAMAAAVTAVWAGIVLVTRNMEKRAAREQDLRTSE